LNQEEQQSSVKLMNLSDYHLCFSHPYFYLKTYAINFIKCL
jgi:hypothetical protein